jgi:adenosylcobyric acid synthase
VALYSRSPVLLVGDIDRGGVFASLVGTLILLEPDERALVRGFVINKFRGDRNLLTPGLAMLTARTGVPVLGVLPYVRDLRIADEDSVVLEHPAAEQADGQLDIVVLQVPHIANFDDFDLLAAEPAVRLRYVGHVQEIGTPDLLILPGSKATMADLAFLRSSGLAARLVALARLGTPVLGICGGYQMLGERLSDPMAVESDVRDTPGLGLLAAETTFLPEKRTRRVRARPSEAAGCFSMLTETSLPAYEIHMGTTAGRLSTLFRVAADGEAEHDDGCCSADGLVSGTYLHGLFEAEGVRASLIAWLAARRGLQLPAARAASTREAEYDRLAAMARAELDAGSLARLLHAQ